MKTSLWRGLVVGAAVMAVTAACDDNPVAEGVDEVDRVTFNKAYASIVPGDSIVLAATPRNQYGAPIGAGVTFEACDDKVSIGTVEADAAALTGAYNVTIHGTSDMNNLGYSCVVAEAGSVSDTIQIVVVQDYLLSTASTGAPGDTIVLTRSVGQPAFDENVVVTATSTGLPPVEHRAFWLRLKSTPDSLYVVLPVSLPMGDYVVAAHNIGDGENTISADFAVTEPASYTDPIDAGDSSTWPEVPMTWEVIGQVDTTDVEDYYLWTIPETTTADCLLEYDMSGANFVFWFYAPSGSLFDYEYSWGTGIMNYTLGDGRLHPGTVVEPGTYYVNPHNYNHGPATSYHIYCTEA